MRAGALADGARSLLRHAADGLRRSAALLREQGPKATLTYLVSGLVRLLTRRSGGLHRYVAYSEDEKRRLISQAASLGMASLEPLPGDERSGTPNEGISQKQVRLIAFYLPQFHAIEENDEWWGRGFTEWVNVRRSRPNYAAHYQPVEPGELGYYDLSEHSLMAKQARLATEYGIHGFCFYFYWFDGHRLLERPLEQLLAHGETRLPFCICWANENWTRRWDGRADQILMSQSYEGDYADRFIREVMPILRDPRYIKVSEAPLLLVYDVSQLPDAVGTAQRWRQLCREHGIPQIHLAAVQRYGVKDPRPFGFDSAVEFPSHWVPHYLDPRTLPDIHAEFKGTMVDYVAVAQSWLSAPVPPFPQYRGVMPAWDNTPRRMEESLMFVNSSPRAYQAWLQAAVELSVARSSVQEPLVFINAWNEWGEGAYLEPDVREGRARLEATREGLLKGLAAAGHPTGERD